MAHHRELELRFQPTADGRPGADLTRFSDTIANLLADPTVTQADFGVAWVREAVFADVGAALEGFCTRGGRLRVVVGLDLFNTTKEGLEGLLALAHNYPGQVSAVVHHNDHPSSTYHPKVYLFRRGDGLATTLIGSPNLTHAALSTNTEAGILVTTHADDAVVQQLVGVLDGWADTDTPLARELSLGLIDELIAAGMLFDERRVIRRTAALMRRRARVAAARPFAAWRVPDPVAGGGAGGDGGRGVGGPRARRRGRPGATVPAINQLNPPADAVLLLRPLLARGTQGQVPVPVFESVWFRGAETAYSGHTGVARDISPTFPVRNPARPNTVKIELPEAAEMQNPVLLMQWEGDRLVYYAFDERTAEGQRIWTLLNEGLDMVPKQTIAKRTADPRTLARFI